jgi:hypothetical protein
LSRIRSIHRNFWRAVNEPWDGARTNLYLVQEGDGGPIKVGIAGHPFRRLSDLQCGNYRRLHMRAIYGGPPGACAQVERYLLKYFGSVGGEWLQAELDDVLKVLATFEEVQ